MLTFGQNGVNQQLFFGFFYLVFGIECAQPSASDLRLVVLELCEWVSIGISLGLLFSFGFSDDAVIWLLVSGDVWEVVGLVVLCVNIGVSSLHFQPKLYRPQLLTRNSMLLQNLALLLLIYTACILG